MYCFFDDFRTSPEKYPLFFNVLGLRRLCFLSSVNFSLEWNKQSPAGLIEQVDHVKIVQVWWKGENQCWMNLKMLHSSVSLFYRYFPVSIIHEYEENRRRTIPRALNTVAVDGAQWGRMSKCWQKVKNKNEWKIKIFLWNILFTVHSDSKHRYH